MCKRWFFSSLMATLALVGGSLEAGAAFVINPTSYNNNGAGSTLWQLGSNTGAKVSGDNKWFFDVSSNVPTGDTATVGSLSDRADVNLNSLYKFTKDGNVEEGPASGNYTTTHPYSPGLAESGLVKWDGGAFVGGASKFIYLKDGSLGSYLFDISDWNGKMDLIWEGFWPTGGGAKLSHFNIFSNLSSPTTPGGGLDVVPEPTSILIWLSASACGVGLTAYRKRKKLVC